MNNTYEKMIGLLAESAAARLGKIRGTDKIKRLLQKIGHASVSQDPATRSTSDNARYLLAPEVRDETLKPGEKGTPVDKALGKAYSQHIDRPNFAKGLVKGIIDRSSFDYGMPKGKGRKPRGRN